MRYIVLLVVALIGIVFIFFNWTEVNTPVTVNLGFTQQSVPLGLMLLVWFAIMFIIVLYGMLSQQFRAFGTLSKVSKELDAQRKLATNAEDSRVTEVKADFDKKWQQWTEDQKGLLSQMEERLAARQEQILSAFKDTQTQLETNNKDLKDSVTSALDNMDDKITKVLISNQQSS